MKGEKKATYKLQPKRLTGNLYNVRTVPERNHRPTSGESVHSLGFQGLAFTQHFTNFDC